MGAAVDGCRNNATATTETVTVVTIQMPHYQEDCCDSVTAHRAPCCGDDDDRKDNDDESNNCLHDHVDYYSDVQGHCHCRSADAGLSVGYFRPCTS